MKRFIINDLTKAERVLHYLTVQQIEFNHIMNYTFLSVKSNINNKDIVNGYNYVHIVEVKKISKNQEIIIHNLLYRDN